MRFHNEGTLKTNGISLVPSNSESVDLYTRVDNLTADRCGSGAIKDGFISTEILRITHYKFISHASQYSTYITRSVMFRVSVLMHIIENTAPANF